MLEGSNIYKKYGSIEVLKDISLQIQPSEIVSIVGASGAGKSTLLHILGTLDKADSGKIYLDKIELSQLDNKALAKVRNEKIGFIFQFHNLMAELTAKENICLPAWVGKKGKEETEKRAEILLDALKISHRADHLPSEMSGGEQQRVAVARALINSPKFVFADEPSGNLDTKNAEELHSLFFELRNTFGCSFVIVTHNPSLAERSDRTIELKDGRIL
ncbi:ABC transporter ATP-binding protein [Lacihabitans sp. CS3-21]|jgi:lipoprotein-releasing system ATP-binding protein|uniref:ABC transporter ATP-binding protein n=1 Tax=Lacihabitans sp. CS3-21 TaxID=2487332 RepID=UPI000BC42750|nr:ABC transporter ATP-binding protein [Lacihabitans sp. CS3-21]MCP9745796.1 ABC transporter ATP-binding protein [Lacihabitans sp. CS3-21]MDP1814493.1 ABC transporter ATP-binding protein [Leadbetterella sp.]OYU68303.1 MAG: lipoprotein-releasing system ATP-binding protein LolD [Cytophagaceae bacterium BCCC1]